VVAHALVALDRVDRTIVALLGALLVILLGVIDQGEAFAAVDLNVIFLLAGMMVIASTLAKTGSSNRSPFVPCGSPGVSPSGSSSPSPW
jgi:Na+/H+ antiporter NhaD/arsenite permease-like protein